MESVKFGKGPFQIGPVVNFLRGSEVSYKMICEVWEEFGYNLGLNEREMEYLREKLSSGNSDLWNMPREILRVWKHGHGDHANLDVLYQALNDINLSDLAGLVRAKFSMTCSTLLSTNPEGLPPPRALEQVKIKAENSKDRNDWEAVDLSTNIGPSPWIIMATSSSQEDSCMQRNVLIPDFPFHPQSFPFTIPSPPTTLPQRPSPDPDQAAFVFPNQDHTKTLVVRSLGPNACPTCVRNLFIPYGSIKSLRVVWERDMETIASIEFEDQSSAEKAMLETHEITKKIWEDLYGHGNAAKTINGRDARDIGDEAEDVNDPNGRTSKNGNAKGYTIFVGNATNLTDTDLMEVFKPYGRITSGYMKRDRGFGFVTFADESSAYNAIREMDGVIVKTTTLRVEWGYRTKATRDDEEKRQKAYEKISKASVNPKDTAIYCSFVGRKEPLTEEVMRDEFSQFGVITDMTYFTGDYMITFKERISAIRAIHEKDGKKTENGVLHVRWIMPKII